jgi:hypothetical protein
MNNYSYFSGEFSAFSLYPAPGETVTSPVVIDITAIMGE